MKTLLVFILLLTSCGIRTTVLKDGVTRIAINEKVYHNKLKFNSLIIDKIDTTVIYEECRTVFLKDGLPVNVLARQETENRNTFYSAYRFYNNGCFNVFILNRETDASLSSNDFNPDYAGHRGIYFKEKSKIKGNLITQVTGYGETGTIREIFQFEGDTLYVTSGNPKQTYIFVKRNLPTDFLKWKANW